MFQREAKRTNYSSKQISNPEIKSSAENYQITGMIAQVFDNKKDLTLILEYKSDTNSVYCEDGLITSPPVNWKKKSWNKSTILKGTNLGFPLQNWNWNWQCWHICFKNLIGEYLDKNKSLYLFNRHSKEEKIFYFIRSWREWFKFNTLIGIKKDFVLVWYM